MTQGALLLLALAGSVVTMSAAANVDYTFGTTMVRFLGKSPNFQIYPNTSLTSYLQLRFSKFEERDTSNQKVQGHSIESLASADPVWTYGNMTNSDGTNLTYVSMTFDPASRNGFDMSCPTSGGSGRRLLTEDVNPSVTVTLYFGLDRNATFPYGFNKTISVSKGGLKFNVEYDNWPFCNVNNTLGMEIHMLIKGDAAAKANVTTGSGGSQMLSISLGDNTTSNITFANYAYEAVDGNRSMAVGVTLDTSGANTVVSLKLPNPAPYTGVYYDPTVTSGVVVTVTDGGAAATVRMTFWSAAAAVLLGALFFL